MWLRINPDSQLPLGLSGGACHNEKNQNKCSVGYYSAIIETQVCRCSESERPMYIDFMISFTLVTPL